MVLLITRQAKDNIIALFPPYSYCNTQVYCDMVHGGWTLIARFSNADVGNWVSLSASFWYDHMGTGAMLSPSTNADMISKAFYTANATDLKLSMSNDSTHYHLMLALNCLSGTFREKITSYGNFRYYSLEYIFTTIGSLLHN